MAEITFKLGKRKSDPELILNAKNIYIAAIEYGCSNRTAAKLVQAFMIAEEESMETESQDEQ